MCPMLGVTVLAAACPFTLGSHTGQAFLCPWDSFTHSFSTHSCQVWGWTQLCWRPVWSPPPEDRGEAQLDGIPGREAGDLPDQGPEG